MPIGGKLTCPYCKGVLESAPTRKTRCAHCGRYILVRAGRLVTEDEATTADWLARVAHLGVSRRDFDRHREELTKKFGTHATVNDTIWRILNVLIGRARDVGTLRSVYWEMGALAAREGKDPKPYLAEAMKLELEEHRRQGVTTVRVVNCGKRGDDPHTCPACKALYGKRMTIDEAVSQMPVPSVCQQQSGCRCSYISENEWKMQRSLS
jgi:hypothetical protein